MTSGSSTPEDPRLVVEIAVGKNPIQGHLAPATGPVTTFTGWLELAAVLEAVRRGEAHTRTEEQG